VPRKIPRGIGQMPLAIGQIPRGIGHMPRGAILCVMATLMRLGDLRNDLYVTLDKGQERTCSTSYFFLISNEKRKDWPFLHLHCTDSIIV
jgi:hypothetical protein